MIFENLFQKYRKTEPSSLFILKNFVLTLLLIALLGYTWLIIWGIYNDNPMNRLLKCYFIVIVINFYPSVRPNISCNFVNASGPHDCEQYMNIINNSNDTVFNEMEDLSFSATPNNGINSLEFMIYLNNTSFNLSDSLARPFVTFTMSDKGAIAIKPWGWIQKYGFKINNSVQTKLRNKFEIIPLVHHPKTTNNSEKHEELKKRLDSLQLFLTEYVVDVQYLEEIYKKNINKK
ncbi:19347_t:CDS:2, partial [Gigaspora margarita]